MYNKRLNKADFLQNPFDVATNVLLGAYLCSNIDGKFCVGKITELEVYIGAEDKACHAYQNRKTKRNAPMFEAGGCAYVFFVYGMYNQFNIVVSPQGVADAILIRSLEPVEGIEFMKERRKCEKIANLTTGPGKLCQALGINRENNYEDLCSSDKLWLCQRDKCYEYEALKRVGIEYAEEYKDVLWRFVIKNNKFISKKITTNNFI